MAEAALVELQLSAATDAITTILVVGIALASVLMLLQRFLR